MASNRAWQIVSPGKLELLDQGAVPQPGAEEVLVRIKAASLNFRDVLVYEHDPSYPVEHKSGLIPCSDGAGIIEEVGQESRWKKGDRVVVHPNNWISGTDPRSLRLDSALGGGQTDGTLRNWLVVKDENLVRAPDGLSLEEASTIYTAGATAYRALFHNIAKMEPGMTVLTQGTGGVSCWAILIASAAGVNVVATSSSDKKLEVARKLGAKHLINYNRTPNWHKEVLKATEGVGVDLVVDVAGAGEIEQTIKSTRFGGLIVNIGLVAKTAQSSAAIIPQLLFGAKTITGQLGGGSRQITEETAAFIGKHQLHVPIATVYDFDEADQALKDLKALSAPGKIVIRV